MSYYTPDQDSENRYYDPQNNLQPDTPSEIGNTAKMLALGIGLNIIGSAITHRLVGGVKSTLRSWESNATSTIRRGIANKVIGQYENINSKLFKPLMNDIKASSFYKAAEARQAILTPLKGTSQYAGARFTTAFKDVKTFIGTSAGVWTKNVLYGLPVAYGVDSLLGVTRDMGLEKKKLYDIPGQISNLAQWTANSSIGQMIFSAAGPALGVAGHLGIKSVQKVFGGEFGKSVLNFAARFSRSPLDKRLTHYDENGTLPILNAHTLKFLSDTTQKRLHFGKNVADAYKGVSSGIDSALHYIKNQYKGTSYVSRTQKAFSIVKNSLVSAKEILRKKTSSSTSSNQWSGLSVMAEVHKFSADAASWATKNTNHELVSFGGKNQLDDFFGETFKRQRKETTLQKIFGKVLKPVHLGDIVDKDFIAATQANLSKKYVASDSKQLMDHLLGLKVGENIYKDWRGANIRGGMVDLSFLDPIHMARRALAPILTHQFTTPYIRSQFSIAKLTNTDKWISDRPDMFATRNSPNFRLVDKDVKHASTVGELSGDPYNSLYIYNHGGKWAIFDNGTVKVANTNRSLGHAYKSSFDKSQELKNSQLDRLEQKRQTMSIERYNKIKDKLNHGSVPSNTFLGFLHLKGFSIPKAAKDTWRTLRGKYEGSNGYKLEFSNFFSGRPDEAVAGAALMENVYGYTGQGLNNILQRPRAVQMMANYIRDTKGKENFLAAMYDNQGLMNAVVPLEAKLSKNNDFIRTLEDVKAFPAEAARHKVVKQFGPFSSMTGYDKLRVNYVDDVFNTQFLESATKTEPHPFLTLAPELERAGIISKNEEKALLLHGKLSVFHQQGLVAGAHNGDEGSFKRIQNIVLQTSKENHWDTLNELIDFTANNKFARPSITTSQEKILNQELHGESRRIKDIHPFVSSPNSALDAFSEFATNTLDRSTSMIGDFSPFRKFYLSNHGFTGNMKYMARMALTTGAVFGAYRILDTAVAANPLFDDTMFKEGITGAAADVVAKARFGMAGVADITGVTRTMKYLHGLAPYSESALPGAFVGSALAVFAKSNPLTIASSAMWGAIANRIASPYLPDLTKSSAELKEIYSGREQVPIMKSPTWLLGGTPWEGSNVIGYSPNWYVRAKSRWKETDTMYGSAVRRLIHEPLPLIGFNVGDIIDPYYMERKHYFTRPYPITGGLFDEVPLIGKTLSATIGQIIKPQKTMHTEYLTRGLNDAGSVGDPYPFAVRPPTIPENMFMMNPGSGPSNTSAGQANNFGKISLMNNKYWSETAAEDFMYDVQNFTGLKGFLAGTISDRLFNTNKVLPTLETAGRMASFGRSFTDLNLGGMGVLTEPLRRIIEKPEYRQYGLNPIPNMLPDWLPAKFLTGDPYTKILRGELRLPGSAYVSTHTDIDRALPARASMIGGTIENIVQYFAGLVPPTSEQAYDIMDEGTAFHRSIQETLATEGMLIQAEALVQDVKNDITGHVDAIIRDGVGGGGRRALEIKTINNKSFQSLDAPKNEHYSQLNFYLKQLGMKKGTLLYVNRDNPAQVKTFDINFSYKKWMTDVKKLQKARSIAKTMMSEGVADTLGYSYSWADRMKILSDVAPNSLEYKEAKQIVEKQIKFGDVGKEEQTKYNDALKMKQARMRSYELYPNRFKGHVFSPDANVDIQSINEDIKSSADYTLPERAIGALWENFTNTNTFLVNKFFSAKDPLEHYKMSRVYGKEYKPWGEPIRGWVDPYMRSLASKTDPIHGAMAFGAGGYVFGGGTIGGILGGALGAIYGAANGLYRDVTGTTYIPHSIEEKREVNQYFDAAKYQRNDMLASLSTGITQQEFLQQRDSTLTAFNQGGPGATVANLFRATSTFEKPYIESFLNTRDAKKREEIIKFVPKDLAQALERQWNTNDSKDATLNYVQQSSNELTKGAPNYQFDKSIMDPRIPLDDIKLKTVQQMGLDKFEFGLGWNEQMLRMQENNLNIQAVNEDRLVPQSESMSPNISQAKVRGMISDLFSRSGIKSSSQIYVDNTLDINNVDIMIRRDRSQTLVNALNRRKKYGI